MAGSTLIQKRDEQARMMRSLQRLLLYVILIFGAIISLFPFYWMINTSLKPAYAIFTFPPTMYPAEASFSAYRYVWNTMDVPRSLFNSVVVAVVGVSLNVFFSSWIAYALAKLEFPFKRLLFVVILALMILPQQLLMIPLFLQVDRLGLINTYAGIILPSAITPFTVFLIRQAFVGIPKDYVDAAIIDGANHFQILFRIAYPIAQPLLLTAIVINFYFTWNSFLWPFLVIRSDELATLPIALARYRSFAEQRWDAIMAAATVVALPIVLLYLVIQRQFVDALTMTGLKG
ncbi:MAG: carbohydrate ABC transporter permease [Caldilineaceae bacterium]|nr:carbohydrate ABC transporter permease [Caldilineaceae bacterium]